MKILCVGDSNTYGYDPRSYFGSRYPEDVRWTDRLNGAEVINAGVNGMTVPRDPSRICDMIRRVQPDLVIVMLGTNDLLMGRSAETISGQMEKLLDSVCDACGGTGKVLLVAPPVLQPGEWVYDGSMIEESLELAELYRDSAGLKGCLFADAGEWDIDMTFDGVHFSPEGHDTFARKMGELLESHPDPDE